MIHKTYLERLLPDAIQKLNNFLDILRMTRFNKLKHANALNEREADDSVYTTYMNLKQFNEINPEDAIAN